MTTALEAEVKRKGVIDYVRGFWREFGYGPSLRDIQAGCGFASSSHTASYIEALTRDGRLIKDPIVARTIRVAGACPTCGCEGHST